ncbi:MAG: hypothetical protein VKP57_04060 [Candidatus Sericytochromatia bacterium]|nr:hypothetical protein [Candidatus Sericytochromatia bacterium]
MRLTSVRLLFVATLAMVACRLPEVPSPPATASTPVAVETTKSLPFSPTTGLVLDPPHAGPGARLTLLGQDLGRPGTRVRVGGREALWEVLARRVQGATDMIAVTVPQGARTGVLEVLQDDEIRTAPVAILSSLTVTTGVLDLAAPGVRTRLEWSGMDTAGTTIDRPRVSWLADPADQATIDASGTLTALRAGRVRLTAQSGFIASPRQTTAVTLSEAPDPILVGTSSTLFPFGAEPMPFADKLALTTEAGTASLIEYQPTPASLARVGRITDMIYPFRLAPHAQTVEQEGILFVDSTAGRVRFVSLSGSGPSQSVAWTAVGGGTTLPGPNTTHEIRLIEPWGITECQDPYLINGGTAAATYAGRRMVVITDAGRGRVYGWLPDPSSHPREDDRNRDSVFPLMGGNPAPVATPVPNASASANPNERFEAGDSVPLDARGLIAADKAGLALPRGVTAGRMVGGTTRIFIADSGYHRIRMLVRYAPSSATTARDTTGYVTTLVGTGKRGNGLDLATSVLSTNLYTLPIGAPMDVALHEFSKTSAVLNPIPNDLEQNLYIADTDNRSILRLRLESPVRNNGGPSTGTNAIERELGRVRFELCPMGYPVQLQVAPDPNVSSNADLLIADTSGNAVWRYDIQSGLQGSMTAKLKSWLGRPNLTTPYPGLLMPTAATLGRDAGTIFVADSFNHMIRSMDATSSQACP